MSARKINVLSVVPRGTDCLSLTSVSSLSSLTFLSSAVAVRKNGIEFHTQEPVPEWSEMSLELQFSRSLGRVQCRGVVVSCRGESHTGYQVTLLFTHVPAQSQELLRDLAHH